MAKEPKEPKAKKLRRPSPSLFGVGLGEEAECAVVERFLMDASGKQVKIEKEKIGERVVYNLRVGIAANSKGEVVEQKYSPGGFLYPMGGVERDAAKAAFEHDYARKFLSAAE